MPAPAVAGSAAARAARPPRHDNRRAALLDAAARLFCTRGYHAASMRDIARAAGMLPGSLYYHFASKEELLVAVYAEGVRRIAAHVDRAVARRDDPWARLEAACAAHLEMLLDRSDYAQVVIRVLPGDVESVGERLARLREDYERRFRALVAGLGLPSARERRYLRLLLMGALNWSRFWYRADGDSPRVIARRMLALVRAGVYPGG